MKYVLPGISWHNRDPVLSVDIQSQSPDQLTRLATAGTDSHVLVRCYFGGTYPVILTISLIHTDLELNHRREWCR